ncbi:MAG: sigma-70 family RNA polymerase sigma factor [Deltaproteobacteria bacterium]|nr:sigma-70 family RNA polymerase sigma factor [Deltaproteobacteria bacterium]MBZ0220665.1 sigma-70 family RNA polymerase sigma factor [Deltaproteobacteria bacterium]
MGLPVVTDSVQSYLAEVSRYPILSAEDEFRVAERYYKTRAIEDAHTLVTSNLRYVIKIALEFRNYGCRLADLIQEGNIGLMTAVKKFNPYKGFRLITYATWWIRSFIQDYILKSRGLVRKSTKALKKKLFYKTPALTDGAAGEDLSYASPEDLELRSDLSLDAPLKEDSTTHLDLLKDEGPGPLETVAHSEESAIVKKEVSSALALLNEKERVVVEKRLMSDEPESLQVIGDALGITRERVRQIESQAMKKLEKSLVRIKQALPQGA